MYIYVSDAGRSVLSDLTAGSAILGFPLESDPTQIHVYYEENRDAITGVRRFADRAKDAAGRCRWFHLDPVQWRHDNPGQPLPTSEYGYVGYPTSAEDIVPASDLIEVALYDDVLGIVLPLGREPAEMLHAWLGSDDPVEFVATGALFERRRKAAGL
jgi:hypothetical protein